ncbi:MAG: ABC transporter permease subunit [Anaerolineae bacterium]|nr:ABC transporter permease subunit [Anaerolineae bacterium]
MLKLGERLRVVWAIAAKDIVDAVKNRTVLAIIVGVAILVLSGQAMPWLLRLEARPQVVVYDEAKSRLAVALKKSDDLRLHAVRSPQELERTLAESGEAVLGLFFPAELDQRLATGPVEIDGYLAHWVDDAQAAALERFFQDRLTALAGQQVRVRTGGHAVYPTLDTGGWPGMVAMMLLITILVIGGAVVPYLIIEEKETCTLNALLVSPASIGQVIAGKAIAGTFYGLLAAGVVHALNHGLVVHWEVAALATVCAASFTVALGLLMGTLFDNAQSIGLWFGAGLMVLLVPMLLGDYLAANAPGLAGDILHWNPSILMLDALKMSFAARVAWGALSTRLGVVFAGTLGILAVVVWRIRRFDRPG